MQKLVIRRQGYGTALATLEFVEVPRRQPVLRLYTTEADADTSSRHAITHVLLAYSRLGVVMVGELWGHAIASALPRHGHRAMAEPEPAAAAARLVEHARDARPSTSAAAPASRRARGQVARPADAWALITGTWSRLREGDAGRRPRRPGSGASSRPGPQAKRPPLASRALSWATPCPMDDSRPPGDADDAADAGDRHAGVDVPSTLIERYVKQLSD